MNIITPLFLALERVTIFIFESFRFTLSKEKKGNEIIGEKDEYHKT